MPVATPPPVVTIIWPNVPWGRGREHTVENQGLELNVNCLAAPSFSWEKYRFLGRAHALGKVGFFSKLASAIY